MTVLFAPGYSLTSTDYPLTHARIGHKNNWLSGGTASASTTATSYFANGPLNTLTYELWKPSSLTATWEYNHGSSASADFCAIGAHNMGTNGNTLNVQYYNGSTWVDLIAATAITSDAPIFVIFASTAAQRWRIQISSGTAPTIGVVKFGLALQMERPIYGGHAPVSMARQTALRSNYSETGQYLGRSKKRMFFATSYEWQNLSASWVEANWPDLQDAIEAEPFFIAWRPGFKEDVGFCQVDEVPVPSNMGVRDLMSVSMGIRSLGYDRVA